MTTRLDERALRKAWRVLGKAEPADLIVVNADVYDWWRGKKRPMCPAPGPHGAPQANPGRRAR